MSGSLPDAARGGVADSERDEAAFAAYQSAKLAYIRAITQDADNRLRVAFSKQRESFNDELAQLRALARDRQAAASAAAARYALRLPHRVRKGGVRPPSLWERARTFNRIDPWYRAAVAAAGELDGVNELMRSRRDRLDAMERETRRSIFLREEAVRKKLQTPEGLASLHADPLVRHAFAKLQGVMNERAKYEERVKRGDVPPQEARDRDMAQRGWSFATVPLQGAMIARLARYGPLEYYVLRDLSGRESLLPCDPALEPLRDVVFELTRSPAGYEAALRHTAEGVPMRVLDHLNACFASDDAAERYARHRAAVRDDRPAVKTAPRDDAEAETIAMLGLLARAVADRAVAAGGGGSPGA